MRSFISLLRRRDLLRLRWPRLFPIPLENAKADAEPLAVRHLSQREHLSHKMLSGRDARRHLVEFPKGVRARDALVGRSGKYERSRSECQTRGGQIPCCRPQLYGDG